MEGVRSYMKQELFKGLTEKQIVRTKATRKSHEL